MKKALLVLLLVSVTSFQAFSGDYHIDNYGAKGDGVSLDTKAIQAAIDECTEDGGGRVIIPAGKIYLIGTIYLKSHVTLYLENGSLMRASTDMAHYGEDTYRTRYKMEKHMNQCLIYSEDADNIAIEGYGTIDGNGFKKYFNSTT